LNPIKLIKFPKQDMKATCEAFCSNLEDDPVAWIEVDVEAPFAQQLQ
jgi:hypothetical protein